MGFLRRVFKDDRGRDQAAAGNQAAAGDQAAVPAPTRPRGPDDHLPDDEVERERALLRAEASRLDNDLIQRQMRYADRAWTPPAQGSERRADDGDAPAG
jgi:hypothetical protein